MTPESPRSLFQHYKKSPFAKRVCANFIWTIDAPNTLAKKHRRENNPLSSIGEIEGEQNLDSALIRAPKSSFAIISYRGAEALRRRRFASADVLTPIGNDRQSLET